MNKNIVCTLLLINSVISLSAASPLVNNLTANNSAEINSSFLNEKGKQYLRNAAIFEDLYRVGTSKSSQSIEVFSGNGNYSGSDTYEDYSNASVGFSLGTTSELKNEILKDVRVITGVEYGFIGSKINYGKDLRKEKLRTLGVNAYIGAEKDNNFVQFSLGGAVGKSDSESGKYERDNIIITGEFGKTFKMGDRKYIYPYMGYDFNRYFIGAHTINGVNFLDGNYSYSNLNFGFYYIADYAKWQYRVIGKWNSELGDGTKSRVVKYGNGYTSSEDGFKFQGDNGTIGLTISYYLEEDLRVSFETLGVYNKEYNDTIYGVKVGYTF